MNVLPPLNLLKQWREAGLSPQEIYQRCEAIEEARLGVKQKNRGKHYRGSSVSPPCECGGQHYAKGKCYRCYQREYMQQWLKRKEAKMIHLNISSKALPTADKGVKKAALPPTLVCQDGNGKEGALEAQINTLSKVDPLAYYCAFVMVEEMDYHLGRGEHYRIAGWYCRTLDEVIRALAETASPRTQAREAETV